MSAPLFSEHWYRVKDLRVRLADDVIRSRHSYRGRPSWVLHRPSVRATWRVDEATFELLARLDGDLTVDELWNQSLQTLGDNAPGQHDVIALLGQLHEAQMLTVDKKLNAERLFARGNESRSREARQRYLNPLFMRFALFDPDTLLERGRNWYPVLFGRPGLIAWSVLVGGALFVLLPQWANLQQDIKQFDWLAPTSVVLIAVLYPLLKLVHEFAHGAAVKHGGGEVHEVGIALMVLLPVPYVDASAATVWPEKLARMRVAAAGILAELLVAAISGLVWAATSPGLLHDIALLLMLLGGLSTLIFNANPLLKFDGYYVLADAIEIPNLAERGKQYWLALGKEKLFGLPRVPQPMDSRERLWIAVHGALACIYRLVLMLSIALWLLGSYFFVGVLLATWVLVTALAIPLYHFAHFLLADPGLARGRATLVTGTFAALFVGTIGLVPFPSAVVTEGVVWLPENAIVRAPGECEIVNTLSRPNQAVISGQALFTCSNPDLVTELAVLEAQLSEFDAEAAGLPFHDRVGRQLLEHKRAPLIEEMARLRGEVDALAVNAAAAGHFVPATEELLTGRFLDQGELAGYIVPLASRTVRLAVEQNDVAALTSNLKSVALRFRDDSGLTRTFTSTLVRFSPAAVLQVSSPALTSAGGGRLPADPRGDGSTVLEPVLDIELAWPADAPMIELGRRVHVRIAQAPTTIGRRLLTAVQRSFMERLSA